MNDLAARRDRDSATAEDGAAPSVIIVAYHFYPSPEVGARRMVALARFLKTRGQNVTVVSAFAGLEGRGAGDPARGVLAAFDIVPLPDRTSAIITFLVFAKRLLLGCAMRLLVRLRGRTATASAAGDRTAAVSASPFHRVLFGALHIVDDKKSWTLRVARKLEIVAARRPGSVMIVSAPPISPLYGVVRIARKLRCPVIVDLRDPVCDAQMQEEGRPLAHRWSARGLLERYVATHADAVVTTSPGLRDRLQSRYRAARARITCIPNGFDGHPSEARINTGHQLVIVYAGELYLNRNPFPFLAAVNRLLSRPGVDASRVKVVFAGECDSYRGISLRGWAAMRPCGRALTIHPRLEPSRLKPFYEEATLLLNFAEGQPIQVPAKTFELLVLGREILVMCEPHSDTAKMIRGLDGVFGVCSNDTGRLDELLAVFYRRHVTEGRMSPPDAESVTRFSRAAQNERYAELIDGVHLGSVRPAMD
jgi:glycosyltransferase involved in cell wall biosynthesis